MAQVTIELYNLLKTSNFKLFDFDYQFHDEQYKLYIEEQIQAYYLFHEIGQETPDLFKHYFKQRFLEIIPYYSHLYKTTVLDYEILSTLSTHTVLDTNNTSDNFSDGTTTAEHTGSSTGDTITKSTDYQFPQSGDTALNFASSQNVGDSGITTSDTSNSSSRQTNTITNNSRQQSTTTTTGSNSLTNQQLVEAERKLIINIVQLIIQDLKECFLLVY